MTRKVKRISGFGRFVSFVSVVVFFHLAVTLYYYLTPVDFGRLGTLGFLAFVAPPAFLMLGLLLLLIAVWSFAKHWNVAATALIASVGLSLFLSLKPSYALWQWAKENNTSVNFVEALLPRLNKEDLSRTTTISYDTLEDGTRLVLDAWPADMKKKKSPRPSIIKVHGATWVKGTKRGLTMWNSWFNTLGYHVFDIEYRMPPPERWRDEVADVKCALAWVKDHAAEYNVDTTRLILMGHSAGANLALLAAYSYAKPELQASCGLPVKVKCVINLYGPGDMNAMYSSTGSVEFVQTKMTQYIGGGPAEFADRYQLLSPIKHVSGSAPPTISIYGEKDRIVPFKEGLALDEALKESGIHHELYILPETDHAFDAN